ATSAGSAFAARRAGRSNTGEPVVVVAAVVRSAVTGASGNVISSGPVLRGRAGRDGPRWSGDSAPRRGPCRKTPRALYVEEGGRETSLSRAPGPRPVPRRRPGARQLSARPSRQ